jgi:hypothetical protein
MQEAIETQRVTLRARRRRGILFVPVALLVALFGLLLSDPTFTSIGLVGLLLLAIGLPPKTSDDPLKSDWTGWVGVGLFWVCVALLLWCGSQWAESDLLIALGSYGLGALLALAFGGRFVLDVLAKQRLTRLRNNAKQYVALAVAVMSMFFSLTAGLPKQFRFIAEKPGIVRTMHEVEAKCASEAAPIPTRDGKPLAAWKCATTATSFTAGTWNDFGSGEWGFTRSSEMPTAEPSDTEPQSLPTSFTKLYDGWWFWKSTTWVV